MKAAGDAVMAHLRTVPAQSGYVSVPVEPTEMMLNVGAMEVAMNNQRVQTAEGDAAQVWRAMIKASQEGKP